MNEPAAFDTNQDAPWNWETQRPGEPDWNLKCDMSNTFENPPYKTSELYTCTSAYSDKRKSFGTPPF